ncbi:TetR/AcrR family transcriptional regulator, partial [Mesorhizobium sp. M2D.F.Ca.ET.145.01.1.1]
MVETVRNAEADQCEDLLDGLRRGRPAAGQDP